MNVNFADNTQLQPVPPPPAVKNDNADGEVTAPPFIVKKSTKFMVDDDTKGRYSKYEEFVSNLI